MTDFSDRVHSQKPSPPRAFVKRLRMTSEDLCDLTRVKSAALPFRPHENVAVRFRCSDMHPDHDTIRAYCLQNGAAILFSSLSETARRGTFQIFFHNGMPFLNPTGCYRSRRV
jgi:hypothetical protein